MSDFKGGDNSGKASPQSANGAKASPQSVNAGKLTGDRGNFMQGAHSGSAKPTSAAVK